MTNTVLLSHAGSQTQGHILGYRPRAHRSILRVARLQHRRKPRRLLLPPPLGAGLLKPPTLAELLQRLLPVQLLPEPADRSLHRFPLFQSYFSHNPNSACSGVLSRTPPAPGRHAGVSPGTAARPSRPCVALSPLRPAPRSNRNRH